METIEKLTVVTLPAIIPDSLFKFCFNKNLLLCIEHPITAERTLYAVSTEYDPSTAPLIQRSISYNREILATFVSENLANKQIAVISSYKDIPRFVLTPVEYRKCNIYDYVPWYVIQSQYGQYTSNLRQHTYTLRPDLVVKFELPENLTAKEAARLAEFIKNLSC